MRWSWRVGSVAGIGLYIHATFLLLIVWLGFAQWAEGDALAGALSGVAFILALFACVLLHELGHALTAKRFGILTRDITLLPIGGVARLERMPDDPRQELWVAIAGPAVNVAITAVLFVWLQATAQWQAPELVGWASGPFLERLMRVNVMLVAFNMLPAFPMDSGRVLRALLATRLEYTRATHLAASIGQGMALLFGLVGLMGNPFLLFIALFVWIGAEQEASLVTMRLALGGIPVSRAMLTDFRSLAGGDTLRTAVDFTLSGSQEDFPVLDDGRLVGVLTRADLLAALAQRDQDARVEDVMRRDFPTAEYTEMLESAFTRLRASQCRTLPVMSRGRLIGLMTLDNVGEFVMIQSALGIRGAAAR
jgi:Zn-dependent protease/CBS domain-containing protein